MTTDSRVHALVEQFLRINNQLTQIQKIPVLINQDLSLSTSALHLIDAIGSHDSPTISQLAVILGVTKGAVSQQVATLEKRGLVKTFQTPDNKKNKRLVLTDAGTKAFRAHDNVHANLYDEVGLTLGKLSTEQQAMITSLLDDVSVAIESYQEKLGSKRSNND